MNTDCPPDRDWPSVPLSPTCLPGEVHVWRVNIDPPHRQTERLWELLDANERARATKLVHDRDRQEFVLAHAALRALLGRYQNVPPSSIRFSIDKNGKPGLLASEADAPLQFSLSHSGNWALVAVSTMPVGVDIERIRPVANLPRMIERICTQAERQQLQRCMPDRQRAEFFRIWTAKEAALKAAGCGLRVNPSTFDAVPSGDGTWTSVALRWENKPSNWRVRPLSVDTQHQAALAVPHTNTPCTTIPCTMIQVQQAQWIM